jgi:hypothetical protein
MRDYRAYILGIDGHRFLKVEGFLSDHSDDAAALNAARQLIDKHDVEVWNGERLLARLSPGGDVWLPELMSSLAFSPPSESERNSANPTEPISLSRVSELAAATSQVPHRAFSGLSPDASATTLAESPVSSFESDAEATLQPNTHQGASHALDLAVAICSRDSTRFP